MEFLEPPRKTRLHSNKDCYRGSRIEMVSKTWRPIAPTSSPVERRGHNPPGEYSKSCKDFGRQFPATKTLFRALGKGRHCYSSYPRNPRPSLCQPNVHGSQGYSRYSSNHRPVNYEHICRHPSYQNGASRVHNEVTSRAVVGCQGRHQGRLLGSLDSSSLQEVLLFLGKRRDVDVQQDALRANHSPLDFHQTHESHKEIPKEARGPDQLVHRRLHPLVNFKTSSSAPPRMDKEDSNLARFQDKPQEIFSGPGPNAHVSGGRTRLKKSHHEASPREDHKTQENVQVNDNCSTGIQSGSRRINWYNHLFLLGSSYRENVREPFDYLDEKAYFCECQACTNLCFLLSKKAVETFLQRQLLRARSFLQESESRLGPNDGCFRLWLEWGDPPLRHKGHVVGIGSIQTHKREGNVSDNILHLLHEALPGWETCGNPHRQRGSILLFKEVGFLALSPDAGPSQAVSILMHRSLHYFRGPAYPGNAKCPCGCWIKKDSQCHRQLLGPRNFVVVFQNGRLRSDNRSRFMCYQGEYQVQPICLTLHRLPSKVCGMGCQEGGLVSLPADLSVPPSRYPARPHTQNSEVPREGSSNSPVSEWPCFGPSGLKGHAKAEASRFLFPFSNEGWKNGKEKEVLQLLDVGMVDIPMPPPSWFPDPEPEPQPSTSSVPPPSPDPPPQEESARPDETRAEPSESMSEVRRRKFIALGLSQRTRKILRRQFSSRTINQYAGAWARFSAFLRKKNIPGESINEATVLNYLSSRVRDPVRRRKGKLAPLSVITELYGIRNPLWAKYDLKLDTTSPLSVTKMFISGLVNSPRPAVDNFPKWNLKVLLDYLESDVFEPLVEKSWEISRSKALILMMLATGRRFEDIQALQKWKLYRYNGSQFIRFRAYEGWKGKAVSSKSRWRPKPVVIYPIASGEERDLSALCPLRAFLSFWDASKTKRSAMGSPQRLWLHSTKPGGFLPSRVINVIKESMILASPLTPASDHPPVGTHHLRKFSFSYAYIFGVCNDVNQLWQRAGSKSGLVPLKSYIRDIPDITFFMCSPLGTLRPNMPRVREVTVPGRS